MSLPFILFCSNPIEKNKVDSDFEDEYVSAKENGFTTLIFDFDNLISTDRLYPITKKIQSSEYSTNVIYRGWMLTPLQYEVLYNELQAKNYILINTIEEYLNCHYLPNSLKFISQFTAKTVFEKIENEKSIDNLIEKSKIFDVSPVILKDYVKSEKHNWETACYVNDASNTLHLKETINNLLLLRGDFLNEGIVIREFLELKDLTTHSKSGMPLTEEYRLFFYNNKLIDIYDYWEEGEYELSKPTTSKFEEIAKSIDSNFFSMDIARQKNGELIIIELGDGQVSGLPYKIDKNEFYKNLKTIF